MPLNEKKRILGKRRSFFTICAKQPLQITLFVRTSDMPASISISVQPVSSQISVCIAVYYPVLFSPELKSSEEASPNKFGKIINS